MRVEEALKIIGIKRDYTKKELKKAYRDKMKKVHPDNIDRDVSISASSVNEAYNLLLKVDNKIEEEYKSKAEIISLDDMLILLKRKEVTIKGKKIQYKDLKDMSIIIEIEIKYKFNGADYREKVKVSRNIKDEYFIDLEIYSANEIDNLIIKVLDKEYKIDKLKNRYMLCINLDYYMSIIMNIVRK